MGCMMPVRPSSKPAANIPKLSCLPGAALTSVLGLPHSDLQQCSKVDISIPILHTRRVKQKGVSNFSEALDPCVSRDRKRLGGENTVRGEQMKHTGH